MPSSILRDPSWFVLLASAPLAMASISGCAGSTPTPVAVADVRHGPAIHQPLERLLALQANCGSLEYPCPREYIRAVDTIVRSGLEVEGYDVIDSEGLALAPRERTEEHVSEVESTEEQGRAEEDHELPLSDTTTTSKSQRVTRRDTSRVVLDGAIFADLTTTEQREIADRAGADGVVSVRFVLGGQHGVWSADQTIEVLVKVSMKGTGAMAWASRCITRSGDFPSVTAALEHTTRCAVQGGVPR